MAITAKEVMSLRKKTGLGMMECKQALSEVGGDLDKAVDLLRQRGLARMDSRSDRESSQGRVAVAINPDHTKAAIIEINTETDFTAGNDAFKTMMDAVAAEALKQPAGDAQKNDAIQAVIDEVRLTTKENVQFARGRVLGGQAGSKVGSYVHFTGQIGVVVELETSGADVSDELLTNLCMHVTAVTPAPIAVTEEGVPDEVIEKERQIARAQAIEQGKPEQIAQKIVEGKVRKFYEEHVLVKQAFIKDDKQRIADLLPAGVAIKGFVRYQLGDG